MSFLRIPAVVGGCVAAIVGCLLLTGCGGEKLVTAKGTITKNQQPLTVGPTGYVEVVLIPDVPQGTPFTTKPGQTDAAGNFEIPEVKPGKYKVAVAVRDPLPGDDKLNGEFSQANTKIVREIDGKEPLKIELTAP